MKNSRLNQLIQYWIQQGADMEQINHILGINTQTWK
jgi:hypothetical protein